MSAAAERSGVTLARFPAKWNHFAEKESRQINFLEQILIAKVFNFGGICSKMDTAAVNRTSNSVIPLPEDWI